MKKLIYILCLVLFLSACGTDSTSPLPDEKNPGGQNTVYGENDKDPDDEDGDDDDENEITTSKLNFALIELKGKEFDYVMMDENFDLFIKTENGLASMVTIQDINTGEMLNIFFDDEGIPEIFALGEDIFILNNLKSIYADIGIISDDELSIFPSVEMEVNWDEMRKELENSRSLYSQNQGKVGFMRTRSEDLTVQAYSAILITLGNCVQAIPAFLNFKPNNPWSQIQSELIKLKTLRNFLNDAYRWQKTEFGWESEIVENIFIVQEKNLEYADKWLEKVNEEIQTRAGLIFYINGQVEDSISKYIINIGEHIKTEGWKIQLFQERSSGIKIPKTNCIITDPSERYYLPTLPRITQTERRELRIDDIQVKALNTTFYMYQYPNSQIVRSKDVLGSRYYDGIYGRIESFLIVVDDHAVFEFLATYDFITLSLVDAIFIGEIKMYASDFAYSEIEDDIVSFTSYFDGVIYRQTKYRINTDMRFIEL